MKKHFWAIACAILFIGNGTIAAQEAGKDMPDQQEKNFKPMPLSPEKSARQTTNRMKSLLNLTEKQYDKLYKLNLKWAREDQKNQSEAPHMGSRPEGAPNFGGGRGPGQGPRENRPPQSMDRRPHRDSSSSADKEKMEKQRQKREKKLKKVLTDEQYARWTEKQHPVMPKDRKEEKKFNTIKNETDGK